MNLTKRNIFGLIGAKTALEEEFKAGENEILDELSMHIGNLFKRAKKLHFHPKRDSLKFYKNLGDNPTVRGETLAYKLILFNPLVNKNCRLHRLTVDRDKEMRSNRDDVDFATMQTVKVFYRL